jgi:hypothetical protein
MFVKESVEVTYHENKVGLFVRFDESCPILIVNSEGI